MARHVVLLRGINIGPRNRIAMPALREALEEAGFTDVQTYLQSGNVVVESRAKPETVRRKVEKLIEEQFGLEIAVVVRTQRRARRGREAQPARQGRDRTRRRYQVTFLEKKLPAKIVRELEEAAAPDERVVVAGREVYAWHPKTIARSKLWSKLAGQGPRGHRDLAELDDGRGAARARRRLGPNQPPASPNASPRAPSASARRTPAG